MNFTPLRPFLSGVASRFQMNPIVQASWTVTATQRYFDKKHPALGIKVVHYKANALALSTPHSSSAASLFTQKEAMLADLAGLDLPVQITDLKIRSARR